MVSAPHLAGALQMLDTYAAKGRGFDAVISDVKLPDSKFGGFELLAHAKRLNPKCVLALVTGLEYDRDLAARAGALGDVMFYGKPSAYSEIMERMGRRLDAIERVNAPVPRAKAREDIRALERTFNRIRSMKPAHLEPGMLRHPDLMSRQRIKEYMAHTDLGRREKTILIKSLYHI